MPISSSSLNFQSARHNNFREAQIAIWVLIFGYLIKCDATTLSLLLEKVRKLNNRLIKTFCQTNPIANFFLRTTMAETSSPSQVGKPPKTVQELITSGQELPEKYIYKGSDAGTLGASLPLMDIPIIDFGLFTSPKFSKKELEKLRSALTFWGCFQAINHGIEPAFLDKVSEIGKQFFAFPQEIKQEYCRENGSIEGYGSDTIISEEQTLDWTDRLYLTTNPEDQRQLKFWPENPESFRETLHEYTTQLEKINEILLKAMAMSLNLEQNCFLDMYGENATMIARFNFYPPCPRPDLVTGVKPHADASAFTYLLQDEQAEGLQFLKDNQWYRVPVIPKALVINAGDYTEIMSNGIIKSPVHRAVTNSERERMSLAVFCIPNPDREIEPVNGMVTEARPRLYKMVKDYVSLYFEYYQRGRRPIEAALI